MIVLLRHSDDRVLVPRMVYPACVGTDFGSEIDYNTIG